MKLPSGCVVMAVLLAMIAGVPQRAQARVPVLPNGNGWPGELGFLMGGAQAALASSGEALWSNPAGLGAEGGARLTFSGDLLRLRDWAAGGPVSRTTEMAWDGIAYAQPLGRRRGYPRFALGLALAMTPQQRADTRYATSRTGSAASLPPGASVPGGDVDTNFPGGITVTDSGEAHGELSVLAPGVGLGIAVADWLRVGLALQVERLLLRERLSGTATYAATDGSKQLDGQSQRTWGVVGEAVRLGRSLGVQMQLSRGIALGIAVWLPADTLRGSGRVTYRRSDLFGVDLGSGETRSPTSVQVSRDGLTFRLESPQRLQVGLAFRSDQFLMEFDVYRLASQAPYDVLPATESAPPATASLILPALRTSGLAVVGGEMGMAFARGERTSLLLAIASDPSPVPPDDSLFRSVSFVTVSTGVYHVRGAVSVTMGLVWREGRGPAGSFVPPDGGEAVPAAVTVRELALRMGGSVAF